MTNPLFKQVKAYIAQNNLIKNGDTIILGLSGGPDSVFLLHYLRSLQNELSLQIIAAHLNHEWRESAQKDEDFCKQLCTSLQVQFISRKISEISVKKKYNGSKEELARNARRQFFEELAQEYNANSIALAHHAQDQQETFFVRLLRGSSLSGLVGMKPRDGAYIRPLLETNKEEIVSYLHSHNLEYCTDETNYSPNFLRNRIRSTIVPALSAVDDRFDKTFAKTLQQLQNTEDYLQQNSKEIFNNVIIRENGHYSLSCNAFTTLHPAIKQRIILLWLCAYNVPFEVNQSFFNEVIRFLENGIASVHHIHKNWSIIKKNKRAIIQRSI